MTTNVKKPVMEFAFIAFALLGVLFGMNIMPFIFGGLDPTTSGLVNGSTAQNTSIQVQEDSLTAIGTYASGSNTQFSTLSTAITLLLLLAIFAFFWRFFVGTGGGKKSGSNFG